MRQFTSWAWAWTAVPLLLTAQARADKPSDKQPIPRPRQTTPDRAGPPAPRPAQGAAGKEEDAPEDVPIGAAGPKVEGLELPPDRTVPADKGYVFVNARTKGTKVRWLLLGNFEGPTGNELPGGILVVRVPPTPGATVVVYAVALVDGEITPFARTTITVEGKAPTPPPPAPAPPAPAPPAPGPAPTPPPAPTPAPAPAGAQRHVAVILDLDRVDNRTALVLNSETLRKSLEDQKIPFRIYDFRSKDVAARRLDGFLQKDAQGNPVPTLIVQTEEWLDAQGRPAAPGSPGARKAGVVRYNGPLPADEAGFRKVVDGVVGGS